ncbi:NAD-dependent epimerase/dehydratase family protein [Sphingobium sp. ZW T5_29]|uniref:NAD-dependent epimerase/dehydratase family protein n=1 Tax=Sphingobium sp. ZW T5_29 TaxID=3378077 RepID=UPI003853DAE2
MKILVVGGTGMIGGHAALHLQSLGHDVSIAGRNPAQSKVQLARLPFIQGDYIAGSFTPEQLAPFDAIIFAAGHDVRHIPEGGSYDEHVVKSNAHGVPAFAALAKAAGVKHFIHVGSFYPHIMPEAVETNAYIGARKAATDGIAKLADDSFHVVSVDAPFVVGTVPGMSIPMFEYYTSYAQGFVEIPPFGPAGGSVFISCQSLSEAITGALERGENGKAYLVGDESLSFADYFKLFFRAAGNDVEVPSLDQEHPMLPDSAILTGRGRVVSYEPDAEEAKTLAYRRNDIKRAVEEIVAQYRSAA